MAKFKIVYQNTGIEAPSGVFLIGRSPECNLVLDDPSVSRVHGAIVHEGGRLYAEDRGSRNGLKVNGMRVGKRQELFDGDRISLGHQDVRILCTEPSGQGDRTVGLDACGTCGSEIAVGQRHCPQCGRDQTGAKGLRETRDPALSAFQGSKGRFDTISEHRPIRIRAGLALKAIRVGKLDEADRLVKNSMEHAFKNLESGAALDDDEYVAVTEALVELAEAAATTERVSALFRFHRAADRLMSPELVEKLYELVRAAGYRKCAEMSGYLALLESRVKDLSPPERFVYKRLEGLVKLCS